MFFLISAVIYQIILCSSNVNKSICHSFDFSFDPITSEWLDGLQINLISSHVHKFICNLFSGVQSQFVCGSVLFFEKSWIYQSPKGVRQRDSSPLKGFSTLQWYRFGNLRFLVKNWESEKDMLSLWVFDEFSFHHEFSLCAQGMNRLLQINSQLLHRHQNMPPFKKKILGSFHTTVSIQEHNLQYSAETTFFKAINEKKCSEVAKIGSYCKQFLIQNCEQFYFGDQVHCSKKVLNNNRQWGQKNDAIQKTFITFCIEIVETKYWYHWKGEILRFSGVPILFSNDWYSKSYGCFLNGVIFLTSLTIIVEGLY